MLETNLIKEAREAARTCASYNKRITLNACVDELQDAFGLFTVSCSRQDMQNLVRAWTRVILALNDLPVSPMPVKPLEPTDVPA